MHNPCYKCEDRFVGCHSVCELYLDWQYKHEQELNHIRKQKRAENDFNSAKIDAIIYTKRNRRRLNNGRNRSDNQRLK